MAPRNSTIRDDFTGAASAKHGDSYLRPTLSTPPIVETDFAELADGSLVEMIEDPEDSAKTLFAVYKGREVRYASRIQTADRVLVPIPRTGHIIKQVVLPRGASVCESVGALVRPILSIFPQCLDINEDSSILLAHFVISTWFIDELPVAPYVALIGLPGSGKSTVLRLLRLLCRRALLTSDISTAAFYRTCDLLGPTLLIDETSTAGKKDVLFHLLRASTTRDSVALRVDGAFKTFGAKAFSWIELPDDTALNSRCLMIPMHETRRTDLKEPNDPQVLQAADELQRQLLFLKFEKYKKLSLTKIPGDERLHSRARDLYKSLALPCGEDRDICERLLNNLIMQQESNREPLSPTQSAVLRYLFFVIHKFPDEGTQYVGDVTTSVNLLLGIEGERFRLSPRAVGDVLTTLGFINRRRTNRGWALFLDLKARKQIHDLVATYGIDGINSLVSSSTEHDRALCPLCKTEGQVEAAPTCDARAERTAKSSNTESARREHRARQNGKVRRTRLR